MKARTLILIAIILIVILALTKPMERGTGNEYFISKMQPGVRANVRAFLRSLERKGYTPVIRDSTRTYEEQVIYKKQNPKNATPGYSSHEKGNAIDLDVYVPGTVLSKKTKKERWIASGVPAVASKYGFKWGGNFKNYADNNHFYF